MILYNSNIPGILKAQGVAIFPFIFISHKEPDCPEWLIRHEKVHIRQQLQWLFIPFFVVYGFDYLKGRIKGMNHNDAYMDIRFEKEAYSEVAQ